MKDQVSRQVQTEMRKLQKKKKLPASHALTVWVLPAHPFCFCTASFYNSSVKRHTCSKRRPNIGPNNAILHCKKHTFSSSVKNCSSIEQIALLHAQIRSTAKIRLLMLQWQRHLPGNPILQCAVQKVQEHTKTLRQYVLTVEVFFYAGMCTFCNAWDAKHCRNCTSVQKKNKCHAKKKMH